MRGSLTSDVAFGWRWLRAHGGFTAIDHPGRAYLALAVFYRHVGLVMDDELSPRLRELASTRMIDRARVLGAALRLPTFDVGGLTLYKRLALVAEDGRIVKVFYPVFPPDRNAQDVVDWLEAR